MAMNNRLMRPSASGVHPEANDWRSRVVANGGSVSGATLAAVSKFCAAIDTAKIRSRFSRLNLFCGNNLSAALVPLYLGHSFGGATFGNSTDVNSNFVSADYAENDGLKGNGSTKYLSTGVPMTWLGTNQLHMFVSFVPDAAGFFTVQFGARYNLATSLSLEGGYSTGSSINRPRVSLFSGGQQPANSVSPITGRTQFFINFNGTNPYQMFGRNVDLSNANNAGAYSSTNTTPFYIFAGGQTGTGIAGYTPNRIDSYSFGQAFASAADRNAYHDAMSAFRSALGRA